MTFDNDPAWDSGASWAASGGDQAPPPSLFPRLEPLLDLVQNPTAYLGGEINSQVKPWNLGEGPTARWCLAFPDAYEVGLPNQGLAILYEVLNARPDALAERAYTPRQDLEQAMRRSGLELFTWDSHRPVSSFDIVGVSLSTELGYTNLLTMLDLAGLPLHAAARGPGDPLVIVGGHCATNPEPLANFIDGAVLGDGEQVVGQITDLVLAWKRAGQTGGRAGLMATLASEAGLYVPAMYAVTYSAGTGQLAAVTPLSADRQLAAPLTTRAVNTELDDAGPPLTAPLTTRAAGSELDDAGASQRAEVAPSAGGPPGDAGPPLTAPLTSGTAGDQVDKADPRPGGLAQSRSASASNRVVGEPGGIPGTGDWVDGLVAGTPHVPGRVAKHTVDNLDAWPFPAAPLVPWIETVHERVSTEIFRGCTRGCRFCQAGMITRPVRERSAKAVLDQSVDMLANTGFDEVSLLSLSSADHSQIGPLAQTMADQFECSRIGLSLPSTRVDAFNVQLARELQRGGRRSGLTFAPEGGSERMRQVINKQVTEQDLIQTVTTAFEQGWRAVKLYFMCGLPTEQDTDVVQIAHLAAAVVRAGRSVTGRRDISCTCSIGPFVPKPHTPFQWAGQCPAEVIDARLRALRQAVAADRSTARAIKVRWAAPRPAILEGLLARGDRRLGAVIERVWRGGARFDGWRESLDLDLWEAAARQVLEPQGLSLDWYTTRQRDWDEVLPWDHLDVGLDRDWLWDEWQAALQAQDLADCRWAGCYNCGVCTTLGTATQLAADLTDRPANPPSQTTATRDATGGGGAARQSRPESRPEANAGVKLAVEYAKLGRLRFASPRVLQRVFERAVRRAGLPMAYSQGFTPHPRLSYLYPAPTGAQSLSEFLVIRLDRAADPDQIAADLNRVMPAELPVIRAVVLDGVDLAGQLEASLWRITLPGVDQAAAEQAAAALLAQASVAITRPQRGDKPAVVREVRPALVALAGPAASDLACPELDAGQTRGTFGGMALDATGGDARTEPTRPAPRLKSGLVAQPPSQRAGQSSGCGILEAVIRHCTPAVRPDDVIAALTEAAGLTWDGPARFDRLAQGLLRGNAGSLRDPLSRL